MNKIKLAVFVIFLMVLIPLTSADTFRQGDSIEISHPIRINGFPLSDGDVNITIKSPSQSPLINFTNMTYSSSTQEHSYILTSDNTQELGEYPYCITAIYNGLNQTSCFSFTITPSGQEITTGQSIIYIFALILGLALFGLSLYGAIKIPYKNTRNAEGMLMSVNDLKYFKIFLWGMTYLLLIFLNFLAWNISFGFLWFNVVSNFFQIMFWILMSGMLPVFILFVIITFINFTEDRKIKEALRRGLPYK